MSVRKLPHPPEGQDRPMPERQTARRRARPQTSTSRWLCRTTSRRA